MKSIQLKKLVIYLDELLQKDLVTDSCPNGLQVQGNEQIKSIATAVSASLESIQAAVDQGVEALIVHHGLFWKGDSFELIGPKWEKIKLLMQNKISLLAYHLPLDMHTTFGNNWKAARDMGWKDLQPFGNYQGNLIGVKGRFSKMALKDFQKQLEDYYQHPAATALGGNTKVQTAALVSGGAYKSLSEAAKAGVDCFITGNFDEPAWNQAHEEKINFFALGHTATEKIGPKALAQHLQSHFRIESNFIDSSNPF